MLANLCQRGVLESKTRPPIVLCMYGVCVCVCVCVCACGVVSKKVIVDVSLQLKKQAEEYINIDPHTVLSF